MRMGPLSALRVRGAAPRPSRDYPASSRPMSRNRCLLITDESSVPNRCPHQATLDLLGVPAARSRVRSPTSPSRSPPRASPPAT